MSTQASSKRRNSRRKPSNGKKAKAFEKKSVAKDGIDFLALVLGLTAGATLILLAIAVVKKPAINPEILAADKDKLGEVATKVEPEDFKTFAKNASVEKLTDALMGLNQRRPRAGDQTYISSCQRRILIADEMMTKKLTDEQRWLAASSKLQTIANMFWVDHKNNSLGVPNLESRLRESASKFKNDADERLSKIARVELARLNSLTADKQIGAHGRELYSLLNDFPGDEAVEGAVFDCLSRQIRTPERIPTATKLADYILSQQEIPSKGQDDRASAWSRISDLWRLCDQGFFELYEAREISGTAELEQLVNVCTDLLKQPMLGEEAVGQIQLAASWLEQSDRYEMVSAIYSSYLEQGPAIKDKRVAEMVVRNGREGKMRCDAIGKPFIFDAWEVNGDKIDPSTFEGLPVLLVYWSSQDKNVQRTLREVDRASERWRKNAVKIIAVQVEKNHKNYGNALAKQIVMQHRNWTFCAPGPDKNHRTFSQIPSRKISRLALLDREHRLADVDIAIEELPTVVNSALATRR
jgi:hypothetical protein